MKNNRTKIKVYIIASALMIGAGAVLRIMASRSVSFADGFRSTVYKAISAGLARVFGQFPFSVFEIEVICLVILLIAAPIVIIVRLKKGNKQGALVFFFRTLCIFSLVFFLFNMNCGVNYHNSRLVDREEFYHGELTDYDLLELTFSQIESLNKASAELKALGMDFSDENIPLSELEDSSVDNMYMLADFADYLGGYYPEPKPVIFSEFMSASMITGIYSPLTIEANYNKNMPRIEMPFTLCHELSHLKGIMPENEANFIAWLACMNSDDPLSRCSGALWGLNYTLNSAYRTFGKENYNIIYSYISKESREILDYSSAYWKQYENKPLEQIQDTVNDNYLKSNGQITGIKSYGDVVELMLRWTKNN